MYSRDEADARLENTVDRHAAEYPTPAAREHAEAQAELVRRLAAGNIVAAVAMPPPAGQTGPVWTDANPGEVGK